MAQWLSSTSAAWGAIGNAVLGVEYPGLCLDLLSIYPSQPPCRGHTGEMRLSFVATILAVGQDEDLSYTYVGVADDPLEPEHEFQLQKSLNDDPQDEELGMDTYCMVLANQATHYGGITACVLEHRVLSIELDDTARQALEIDGLSIDLKLDEQQVFALAEGLRRMFENDRCSPVTLKLGEEC